MSYSATSICNLALGKIGSSRIASLDDATQPARYSTLYYVPTRDEVLRAHAWNFATARVALSALSEAPAFGWAYQYQLPADCLRVLQLNAWEEGEARDSWEIEGDRLLTEADSAQIKYVKRETDAALYDSLFVEALAVKLASKLCVPLSGSRTQAGQLIQEYEGVISGLARQTDASESRPKRKLPWVESDLVRSRSASGF